MSYTFSRSDQDKSLGYPPDHLVGVLYDTLGLVSVLVVDTTISENNKELFGALATPKILYILNNDKGSSVDKDTGTVTISGIGKWTVDGESVRPEINDFVAMLSSVTGWDTATSESVLKIFREQTIETLTNAGKI